MSDVERTAFYTCPLCEATCGLEIRVRGDEVVGVRGDPQDVLSGGYMCPKGASLGKFHHDPDRLRTPLIKRDGKHVEVSWTEAFAQVAAGFEETVSKHGRGATSAYIGNATVHNLAGCLYVVPLAQSLGTTNIFSASTMDTRAKDLSTALMFGGGVPVPDLDRTDYLLMLGANPLESNGSFCTTGDFPGRMKRIRERGGRVVVIDPRRTRTAKAADEHLFIRPGSDGLLLAALIQVLFDEELIATNRLSPMTSGVEQVRNLTASFDPERVSDRTGVPADTIRRLAREFAQAPAAAIYSRMGTHASPFATLNSWAVDTLAVLTGNLDRPGGSMFSQPAHVKQPPADASPMKGPPVEIGRWKTRVRGLPETFFELPVVALAEEIDTPGDGQIRLLLTLGGNPALSAPNGDRLNKALSDLDFMVSVDPYLNETTRHANVILPPPSPLERSHYDAIYYTFSTQRVANFSTPVFECDAPSEGEIIARLAQIFRGEGLSADPDAFGERLIREAIEDELTLADSMIAGRDPDDIVAMLTGRNPVERLLDVKLRVGPYGDGFAEESDGLSLAVLEAHPHGMDFGALESALPGRLRTPSGTIELAPQLIVADFERLDDELSQPAPEFVLIGRRSLRSNNSWMHNVDALVRGRDRCTLQIHPEDAARLGLGPDDAAQVSSRVGEVTIAIEITDDILCGVVSLPHGYGHDEPGARLSVAERRPGVNSNRLTDDEVMDPVSTVAVLNGIPVQVRPAVAD